MPQERLQKLMAQAGVASRRASEEIIAAHTCGQVIRGTTFMSGTKHSDTHVQLELDTATWIGPFEPGGTRQPWKGEAAARFVCAGIASSRALSTSSAGYWSPNLSWNLQAPPERSVPPGAIFFLQDLVAGAAEIHCRFLSK